jgi:NAD-dependent DNA ligase
MFYYRVLFRYNSHNNRNENLEMVNDNELLNLFNRSRIDDRQVDELIGLSHGLIADGMVSKEEADYLQKWLVANTASHQNPMIHNLMKRVQEMLQDNILDDEERAELFETLKRFAGGDFELGELQKSTSLPLDEPPPVIQFEDARFCFTGTFAYGSRKDCEAAVKALGATSGGIASKTDVLVIGAYATDSWAHSSFGRKIEKALEIREEGSQISIVSELHWVSFLP